MAGSRPYTVTRCRRPAAVPPSPEVGRSSPIFERDGQVARWSSAGTVVAQYPPHRVTTDCADTPFRLSRFPEQTLRGTKHLNAAVPVALRRSSRCTIALRVARVAVFSVGEPLPRRARSANRRRTEV